MKKKPVPILIVIGVLLVAGGFVVAATKGEPSDKTGLPAKTVAIKNVPTGQISAGTAQSGSIYDQIMQRQSRMNQRLNSFLNDPVFSNSQHILPSISGMGMGYPKTRFFEKDKEYVLQFAVPGMDKKNIAIELHGNVLTVSAKNSTEAESNNNNNYQSYRNISNAFTQSVTIPPDVDTAKITSSYKNGVLTIDLPKDTTKAGRKTIKISID